MELAAAENKGSTPELIEYNESIESNGLSLLTSNTLIYLLHVQD